jgi:hypothetical protein
MTEMVKLELSDEILNHAKESASRTGQSLEEVLLNWLERGASTEKDIYPLVPGAEYPIYTPFGNEAVAEQLWQILNDAEHKKPTQDK